MIKSMTGYGRAVKNTEKLQISVDIKSVNSRYLELNPRISRAYSFLEERVRTQLSQLISRGKVDCYVQIEPLGEDDVIVETNTALASGYTNAARLLAESLGLTDDFTVSQLMQRSDIFSVRKALPDEDAVWSEVGAVLTEAVDAFVSMRETEGAKLKADIVSRAETIIKSVEFVEKRSPESLEEYRNGLFERMKEVLSGAGVDENRILQEAALYADKIAVDEETVRLRSHIGQLIDLLQGDEPVGRKLDFIVQEMNRETNTIGSKANDLEIAKTVIDMKAEIEKIREQIQNIE